MMTARRCMQRLTADRPLDSRDLAALVSVLGEPADFLRDRPQSAFYPSDPDQRAAALAYLEDFIDDRRVELRHA